MSGPALPEIALPAGTRVIADLHLDPRQTAEWQAFERWLAALEAPALLVLGDLFEYWIGPAQAEMPEYAALLAALRRRSEGGTALSFLHGNRDFLLGADFERAVAGRVFPAGVVARLPGGARVLCLHGDELATRDKSYQRLRRVLRSRPVRALAEVAPRPLAGAVARRLRKSSRGAVAAKAADYVALQADEAERRCAASTATTLVCGHAHRFRDERLPSGARWIVLDAFGHGAHDVLGVDAEGALVPAASRAAELQGEPGSLFSLGPMNAGPRIIALDGPAGVGKSTLARALARELGYFFLDTGAMYRAVTLRVLERGLDPSDGAACARVANELSLDFDREGHVLLDGHPAEPAIRGAEVTHAVSLVAAHAGVRTAVVARQRALAAEKRGVVAEGRDTTTIVFPRATHKFYLSASVEERARRRAKQENALGRVAEIRAELERRDGLDSSREHSPLLEAADAVRIETDGLDVPAVVTRLLAAIREGAR